MTLTNPPVRSVFDCNVFLQAMANPNGPAGACFAEVKTGRIELFVSQLILSELTEVAARPVLVRKLALTADRTRAFVDDLTAIATWVDPVPSVFLHPRDPKDNLYVDLAIAIGAHVITSRDRHLLALRDPADPIGADFMSRFASIEVLTPVQLLQRVRAGV